MTTAFSAPMRRLLGGLTLALLLVGAVRAALLLAHAPLLAYANNYDEVRYTSCFHLYPERAPEIGQTENSPQAPFEFYVVRPPQLPMCYASSELVFLGAAMAIQRVEQSFGAEHFSVRWIGALRLAALLALAGAFCRAWWRRGQPAAALAQALLLAVLFSDPANTLYLNTFYAEWTALLALYATLGLVMLWCDAPRSAGRFTWLALAAFALATSKLQHLLLPLAFAAVVLSLAWLQPRRPRWQGLALLFGALLGVAFQLAQLQRDDAMSHSIHIANSADVVFTALLPHARDPAATAARLGLEPACLAFSGRPAWQLPDLPERACPGLRGVGRAAELGVLLREPDLTLRLFAHAVQATVPWMADNIGHVAGTEFGKLPAADFTLSRWLDVSAAAQYTVLAAPPLALVLLLALRGWRRWPRAVLLTALTVTVMLGTLGITVLGDGLADVAKQSHLVFNAALGWALAALACGGAALARRRRPPPRA